MKKEFPILMSTEMVRAILSGRKTMTRRAIKTRSRNAYGFQVETDQFEPNALGYYHNRYIQEVDENESTTGVTIFCPYGRTEKGSILWVRESGWVDNNYMPGLNEGHVYWKSDELEDWEKELVRAHYCPFPAIHMYKDLARIWLEVTDIRVERLQNITPHDACAEGIEYWNIDGDALEGGELQADFKNYTWTERKEKDPNYEDRNFPTFANCIDSFRTLWQSINGEESWNVNPWVWVVSFKVLSTTGKP